MSDTPVRHIRGRVIEIHDAESTPHLIEFTEALSAELGHTFLPLSVRVGLVDIVKLSTRYRVTLGDQTRMVVPATLNNIPVTISHQYPMRPPLLQRVLVFSETDLVEELELDLKSHVRVGIEREYFGRANMLDWGRSLGGILNSGIDK